MYKLTSEEEKALLKNVFDKSNPNQMSDKKKFIEYVFFDLGKNKSIIENTPKQPFEQLSQKSVYKPYIKSLAKRYIERFGRFLNCDPEDLVQALAKKLQMQKTSNTEWSSIKTFLAVNFKYCVIELLRPYANIIYDDEIIKIKTCKTKDNKEKTIVLTKGYSNFSKKEFKPPLSIEKLCKVINDDNYDITINIANNSIKWLNALLRESHFYDALREKNPHISLPGNIMVLVMKTEACRNNKFSELDDDEQNDIKKFNRLLLEHIYPQETPKSSEVLEKVIPSYAIWEFKKDSNGNPIIDPDPKNVVNKILIPKRPSSNVQKDKNDNQVNFDINSITTEKLDSEGTQEEDDDFCEHEEEKMEVETNEDKGFNVPSESEDYRGEEHNSEFKTSLRNAMDKVSMISPTHARDIKIIEMKRFEGKKTNEIAKILNMSEENVRQRIIRMCKSGEALYKLRKMLYAFDPKTS